MSMTPNTPAEAMAEALQAAIGKDGPGSILMGRAVLAALEARGFVVVREEDIQDRISEAVGDALREADER